MRRRGNGDRTSRELANLNSVWNVPGSSHRRAIVAASTHRADERNVPDRMGATGYASAAQPIRDCRGRPTSFLRMSDVRCKKADLRSESHNHDSDIVNLTSRRRVRRAVVVQNHLVLHVNPTHFAAPHARNTHEFQAKQPSAWCRKREFRTTNRGPPARAQNPVDPPQSRDPVKEVVRREAQLTSAHQTDCCGYPSRARPVSRRPAPAARPALVHPGAIGCG
jgi:hypothetical protein